MVTMEPLRGLAVGDDPHDSWSAAGLSRGGLGRFVKTAQAAVGLTGEVDVLLADDRTLRRLNREFRGKDKATDVLSFPAVEEFATDRPGGFAGDLAISLETAARQAREHGHSLRDEVRVLLLHGLLHLSGMDHETDRGEMAAKETELRKRLRLPSGLIARVEGASAGREKSRSLVSLGMTERKARATTEATAKTKTKATAKTKTKATAKTTATAKAKAGSLRDSSREMRVASKDGTAAKKRGRR